MKTQSMRRLLPALAALALALAAGAVALAAQSSGTLATSSGDAITGEQLRQMIQSLIPSSANGAVYATECYGGDLIGALSGLTNVAAASATSCGQVAYYGGYDDDAAAALKPGAGRTGQTVHDAGVGGKHAKETPTTGGGLNLAGFSLEDTNPTGNVQSRHILIYAGKPDADDVALRDKIKNNFGGQANTTVRTVGGSGTGGWDKPGTAKGLREAMLEIGGLIAAAPDPSREQFIMFFTDHGGLRTPTPVATTIAGSGSHTVNNVPSFTSGQLNVGDLNFAGPSRDSPGFAITVSGFTYAFDPDAYDPYFNPGDWRLTLTPQGGQPCYLTDFIEEYIEFDNNVIDGPGEGVRLIFPTDGPTFSSFFDVFFDLQIENLTQNSYFVELFDQTSGTVQKVIPEPALAGVGALCLSATLFFRRLRRQDGAR